MLALRPKTKQKQPCKSTKSLPSLPRGYRSTRLSAKGPTNTGGTRFATLVVLVALAAGGVFAFRHFFHRGGEGAVQLIPADTLVVVTLDASPSPAQVPVFKHIMDTFKAEHLDAELEKAISNVQNSSPLARDVRPFVTGSLAYALLKTNAANTGAGTAANGDNVVFLAVSDARRVQEALTRDAQKNTVNSFDYYTIAGQTNCMAVIGSYLVMADKPQDLTKIEAVRAGETQAISTQADYQQARASLPSDSNIMLFVSQSAIAQAQQAAQGLAGGGSSNNTSGGLLNSTSNPLNHAHYLAMGFAVHDRGIDGVMLSPAESPANADGQAISHIAPFDAEMFRKMPSGAYGIIAMSQPGKYYHYATAVAASVPDFQHTMDEGVKSFEQETGMSVTRDVLPGVNGNLALAVYPDANNSRKSVDGLLVMDDANGADPAKLADLVRAYAERASAQHGGQAWHYTSENRNGVLIWTLNPEAQRQIQSLGGDSPESREQGTGNREQGNPFSMPSTSSGSGSNPYGGMGGGNGSNGADRRGDNGGLLQSGGSSRQSNDTDVHIHASHNGRVYDDTFDLHHGDDRVHADHNGVDVQSGPGNTVRVNRGGLSVHSDDGSSVDINPNGIDIHAHDDGTTPGEIAQNNTGPSSFGQTGPGQSAPGVPAPPHASDMQEAMRNKTVAYAQIGHVLLIASSRRMLDRAIAAYQSGSDTLANDPGYAQMRQQMIPGTQNALLLNLPSILEAVRPYVTDAMGGNSGGMNVEDILHLAGAPGNSLVVTQQYDGKTFKTTFFLPLDYEKVIHLIGGGTRHQ